MRVRCEMRKWNGFPTYRFDAELLGRDDYGTWLGLPAPTPYEGPKGPGSFDYSLAILIPPDEWWIAAFNDEREPNGYDTYIDITTASEWVGESLFRTIDLDLDVVRYHDGRITLEDEDEFEERRVALGYPHDIVEKARAKADDLLGQVKAREEPFAKVGRRWLETIM